MINKDFYIKFGSIYGLISIVYLMITYLMGVKAMTSMWNSVIQLILFFGMFVLIGMQARKAMGGIISFGEAFKAIIISYALGLFLSLLFNFVLNTMIDPELPGKLFDEGINTAVAMMEKFGMEEDMIEQSYDIMTAERDKVYEAFTVVGFIQSYAMMLMMGAIGAAIAGLIAKKNNPNPFAELDNAE